MTELVTSNSVVESRIFEIRGIKVILDKDVADLYGVTTKEINQAISRNPDKFPDGYIITLDKQEKLELVTNCDRFENLKHSTVLPKAFTEKSLYMLATILKSPIAVATTLSIIETFANVREIKHTVINVFKSASEGKEPKKIIERVGKLVGDLIMPQDDDMETISIEDEAEFKFMGIIKLTRKIIKQPKKK